MNVSIEVEEADLHFYCDACNGTSGIIVVIDNEDEKQFALCEDCAQDCHKHLGYLLKQLKGENNGR